MTSKAMTTGRMTSRMSRNDAAEGTWQENKSVLQCNRYMLHNQIDCDVQFTVAPQGDEGENVTFGAHKYVLISRSPVMYALLNGPLASQGRDICISDIEPATFWEVLRYIYYEDITLSEDSVFAVLYAAKKYMLHQLADKCSQFLQSILSPENVCNFLENEFLFDGDSELKKKCFHLIEHQSKRVFHSDSFYKLSREVLIMVLKTERLALHEVDVFRACVHWAERKCSEMNLLPSASNKRNVLGEALNFIHFPAMSINEFTKIVAPTDILDKESENSLFRLLLGDDTVQNVPFLRSSRNFVTTRCDFHYDGFSRHTSLYTPLVSHLSTKTSWHITLHCENCIKVSEIGFLGQLSGNVTITQNGYRKLDISNQTPAQQIRFGDDLEIDAGQFTIASDSSFTYSGEYFIRTSSTAMPSISTEQKPLVQIKEISSICLLSYLILIPTDEIYFIENYYNDDSESNA